MYFLFNIYIKLQLMKNFVKSLDMKGPTFTTYDKNFLGSA